MWTEWFYYVWATLFVIANAVALCATVFALPGNWMIAGLTIVYAYLLPADSGEGISWLTVIIIVGLAVIGEGLEMAAGAATASKQGASRRAMFLSLVGTMLGSLLGAFVTIPIPVIGPIIGALGGGAVGAFTGGFVGESWKGSETDKRLKVGKAAVIGRLWGTLGKLSCGAIMFVIAAIDAFF
jgi:uncharacterized protein YqgC (DUF456 family)